MKIIYSLFLIAIVAVCLQSCKKDDVKKNAGKTYLLKKVTTVRGNETTVDEYTYDSRNRMTEVSFSSGAGKFKYSYDDQDKLIKVESYNGTDLYSTQTYSYASGAINISEKFSDGSVSTKKFELSGNKVTKLFNYGYNETVTYNYDSKGNISSLFITNVVDSDTWNYTYDDKKHPLSMIGAPNPHITFLEHLGMPYTNLNNITSSTQTGVGDRVYVYNEDGFPVSVTTTDRVNNLSSAATYEYIVK